MVTVVDSLPMHSWPDRDVLRHAVAFYAQHHVRDPVLRNALMREYHMAPTLHWRQPYIHEGMLFHIVLPSLPVATVELKFDDAFVELLDAEQGEELRDDYGDPTTDSAELT